MRNITWSGRVVLSLLFAAVGSGLLLRAQNPQQVGTFAPMAFADERSHAATATLADGRTLIVGGFGADGNATAGIVAFNPADGSIAAVGELPAARVGHSATALKDGRVLVAGGLVEGAASASLAIFNPADGTTTALETVLTSARSGHAAARLADGTVLIAGGSDGSVALATSDIFDPATGAVAASGAMNAARAGASATLLIDNRVLVAGGNNGADDLLTAEIYYPFAGTWEFTSTNLSVARSGHAAVLLPWNGSVLIAGGQTTIDGVPTAVANADLFLPAQFPDPYSYGMGTFVTTAPNDMSVARAGAYGGPYGDNGYAFVAGGAADAERYRFATIKTDKDDYAPGELAVITGSGWQPNETVTLLFQEDPAVHEDYLLTVMADAEGNFDYRDWAPDWHDLNVRFYLMASDSQSRAQITFTDANPQTLTVASPTSVTVTQGSTATYGDQTLTVGGNNNPCTVTFGVIPPLPAGATPVWGTNPVTTTGANFVTTFSVTTTAATPTGTYTFQVTGTNGGGGCQGPGPTASGTVTLIVDAATVNTTTAVSNATATYGDAAVTLNATVTPTSGPAINSGSVTFTVKQGATTIGVATADTTVVAGAASVSYALPGGTAAGPYTIDAAYTPGAGFNTSSGAGTLTIDQRPLTITAANKSKTYGATVVFDTTTPSTDFTVSGLINSDSVSSVTLTSAGAVNTAGVSNYPIVPSAAVGSGLTNYIVTYVNGSLTVDPAPLTITALNKTKTYGGTVTFDETTPSTDFTVGVLLNSDTVDSITLTSAGAAATATVAGSPYAIVPSAAVGTGLSNYTVTYVNGSLTVDPAPLTITALNKTKTYGVTVTFDETTPSTDFTVGVLLNSDTVDGITLTSAGAAATATVASSPYAIVPSGAVGTGLSNYTVTYVNGSLTVDPAPLTITALNKTKTYGVTVTFDETTPSTDFTVGVLLNSDTVDSITLTSAGAAATATVASSPYAIVPSGAVGTGLSNYTVTYVNGSLTVDPAPLTITALNKTKTYGGTVTFDETTPSTDFTVGVLLNSDTVASITLTSAGAAATATVASSPYTIVPSAAVGTGLTNYSISYVNGALDVDPAPLTVTAANKTKTYGQTVVFDDTTPSTDFSVGGLVNADSVDSVTLTSVGAAATATVVSSPYAIVPSAAVGTGLGNYTVSYVNGSLTVDPAPLTITALNKTKAYGQTVVFTQTTPSLDFSVSGLLNGDSVTSITLTSVGAAATATVASSPYAIVPSAAVGTGLGNYTVSYVNGSLTVDPAPLTITALNKTKAYGQTVVFTQTTPSLDFSVSGLLNGDSVTSITLTSAGAAAAATVAGSPYTIVPSAAVGTGLTNYSISYVNGALDVDPAPLTVTAANKTKTYGQTVVFTQTTPSPDFGVTGLLNGDTVTSITLTSAGAAATATVAGSPYTIVPSAAVGAGLTNYSISYVNGALDVDPAPLTVTAANKTKTYGQTVVFTQTTPSPDFSVTGLLNGDTVTSITLTSAGAAATATVSGSPYTIVPSAAVGTGLTNYSISYVNRALDVDPAPLTVTAANKTKTYGQTVVFTQTTPSPDFSVTGLLNGDTVTSITLTSAGAAATATVSGSPYAIVPSAAVGTGLANYSVSYVNGALTVNTAPLTVTASSHTIIFGGPVPTITPSYAGFVAGDDAADLATAPTCTTAYTVGSLIGNYATNCVGAASGNYYITHTPGNVSVLTACTAFNGFLPPIGGAVENLTGGSFADPVRAFKLNSTIPVKFAATCFGAPLTTGVHTLTAIKYSNATDSEPPIDATPTDAATTGNQFRLTGAEWHFNLSTKGLGNAAQGTWLLKATLFDGSSYSVWVSIKK